MQDDVHFDRHGNLMETAIWWVRRDLRLGDNLALMLALERAKQVIPLFIMDPKLLYSPYAGKNRVTFLFEGLRKLDVDLRTRGSGLVLQQGDPLVVLHLLCRATDAQAIFAEADVSPYAKRRDEQVSRELPLVLTRGITVHSPQDLLKPDGNAYTVFTPFKRRWESIPFPGKPLPTPENLPKLPMLDIMAVSDLPRQTSAVTFVAGEVEAHRRLGAFIDSDLLHYARARDRLDLDSTSGLSPYLKFGMISARQAAWAANCALAAVHDEIYRKSVDTWLTELIWRDFYSLILDHYPGNLHASFRKDLNDIHWLEDPASFTIWAEGRTGYPVIDAAMRQLNATGWMHNRARMIAASFLVKDLLIDWRSGQRYFMQHLLDGDPASNNGGWQWTAGTGTDAAPYFRIFNPVLQGKKFDPLGAYVRRWVTELSPVPDEYIHSPWTMPSDLQRRIGCVIGKHYPHPIVEHANARLRALEAYRRVRA
jgi:deoxyribodipyrimidine photo-lyase